MTCKLFSATYLSIVSSFFLDKTFNDIVPQLIPREPINNVRMKSGLSSIRSNIQDNLEIEIDPTSDAPIAVFDGKIFFYHLQFSHRSLLLRM